MVDLTTRLSTTIYNIFVVYNNSSVSFSMIYPANDDDDLVNRIVAFGPACCATNRTGEFYVLLFTDGLGRHEYVHCLQADSDHLLCFSSFLPWFQLFRFFLGEIKNMGYYKCGWNMELRQLLESIQMLPIPPATQSHINAQMQRISIPDINLFIPCLDIPQDFTSFEYYYSALDTQDWIHIFVDMLLEKSVVFFSQSREKLTHCIIASISLIHPLTWVFPIYLTLTRKLLEMLQSPVPFIAGIHSCMIDEAMEFIGPGIRVVNLDKKVMGIITPKEASDSDEVPFPIFEFLKSELKISDKQLRLAMTSKAIGSFAWKTSDIPIHTFLMQKAQPFSKLIINLLGFFRECVKADNKVDFVKLSQCQACPSLDSFLSALFQSQMIHYFFEVRLARNPNDSFEAECLRLTDVCLANISRRHSNKLNFGDSHWIACKSLASLPLSKKYSHFRKKIESRFSKLSTKHLTKSTARSETFHEAEDNAPTIRDYSSSFNTGGFKDSPIQSDEDVTSFMSGSVRSLDVGYHTSSSAARLAQSQNSLQSLHSDGSNLVNLPHSPNNYKRAPPPTPSLQRPYKPPLPPRPLRSVSTLPSLETRESKNSVRDSDFNLTMTLAERREMLLNSMNMKSSSHLTTDETPPRRFPLPPFSPWKS